MQWNWELTVATTSLSGRGLSLPLYDFCILCIIGILLSYYNPLSLCFKSSIYILLGLVVIKLKKVDIAILINVLAYYFDIFLHNFASDKYWLIITLI